MRRPRMSRAAVALAALCCAAAALPAGASAAPAPAWALTVTPLPANFAPGTEPEYMVVATNVGAGATTAPTQIEVQLPPGLLPTKAASYNSDPSDQENQLCPPPVGQVVKCQINTTVSPGRWIFAQLAVSVSGPEEVRLTKATVSGGGGDDAATTFPTQVQAAPLPFDFLPGFQAPLSDEEGETVTLAGSHPYQQTVDFGFPTENPGDGLTNDGHPRNFSVELPRGIVGKLGSSQVLCTEVQLTGFEGCPKESQVALADVTTLVEGTVVFTTNFYNMVPPPGAVAEIATNVASQGIYTHIIAGVRSDDDYGIETATHDTIAFGLNPIFNLQAQVWGDPSAAAHDGVRGTCTRATKVVEPCSVPSRAEIPFLTMPSDCPGEPLLFEVLADSWEEPSPPASLRRATYESADLSATTPVTVEDCAALDFKPEILARPSTDLTDSPAGMSFTLHQPQEEVGSRAPANLRDATVAFPAGLAVNPSQAAGLDACSEDQIGFLGADEQGMPHFSKSPQSCPNAAKIGTFEVTSPSLARRNAAHEVEETPEGDPILETLDGSIYIAQPFGNPFDSLLAVYLVIEDHETGIVAKLAGEGQLDPASGQITTRFEENPEIPFEDVKVHIFGGDRGAFVTPPTCTEHTTQADLVPWSAPEGKDALPADQFTPSQAALPAPDGSCPTSEAQMPNAPAFSAGTLAPAAAKHSPLLLKLARKDGSQRFARLEATLPTGVSATLAGVGTCSEADIAKARSREAPQKGVLEQADPSCPAGSQIGTAIAAAGAGSPYYTAGKIYLAGPYKGAPLSAVTIAPAVAGPFDLGTVVIRAALYLDPTSAQGRIVSDPLPQVLQGVPIDLRSASINTDRPGFALNPTSCAQKSFGGALISALGQAAPLFERFQVGGCQALPYRPQMSVRLFGPTHRGAHPRLRAVFTAKAGEANSKAVSFTFPRSEFIDQAHFRTICTRVQFAAAQCPAGSVYGHVRALSPLLDYPLEGPVYLRSSSHKLPDIVATLHGPPYQPLFFEAAGRVDSVNGGLRVRFQGLPDAPISKLVFTAQGAKKGLFQNSTDICRGQHRATLKLDAQNGKIHDTKPLLEAQCKGAKKGKKGGKGGKGGGR
jgi:hypothetical protein